MMADGWWLCSLVSGLWSLVWWSLVPGPWSLRSLWGAWLTSYDVNLTLNLTLNVKFLTLNVFLRAYLRAYFCVSTRVFCVCWTTLCMHCTCVFCVNICAFLCVNICAFYAYYKLLHLRSMFLVYKTRVLHYINRVKRPLRSLAFFAYLLFTQSVPHVHTILY